MPLLHKHLIIRAEVNNPPVDPVYVSETWLPNMIESIGMKILKGPYAVYSDMEGNRGLTAAAIIETSHIALHVWDECEPALMQLDVYTCSTLDPDIISFYLEEFEPVKVEAKYLDREKNLKILKTPKFNFLHKIKAKRPLLLFSFERFKSGLNKSIKRRSDNASS